MTQIDDIRNMFFREGLNISQIAQQTGHDRKTIRRCINREDWNVPIPSNTVDNISPKLGPYKSDIDIWLTEDLKARKKQRHTAKRVYDRLCEKYEAFNCSYRTVATYVAAKKKELYQNNRCSLPLEHPPGEAQVDFGKAEFYENGICYYGSYLNVSFPYSNTGYTQLFKAENTECLLEGLKTIFEHIGGVPCKLWFDNTSTIVISILKEGKRELTEAFLRFKQHYGFDAVFCNPDAGHEKGNVEAKVGYHRRNLLVPVPHMDSLVEFNKQLLNKCDADKDREHYRKDATIADLFEQDKKELLELPSIPYDVCSYISVKTNAYGKFSLNGGKHTYSTAPKYANSRVQVKMTAHSVIPLDQNLMPIVTHQRLYGDNKQESMNWIPYLTQLSRNPGALKYSGIYDMLPDPLKEYLDRCQRSERGKILKAIADICMRSSFEQAIDTVSYALTYQAGDIDSLMAIHNRLTGVAPELKPIKLSEQIPRVTVAAPDMAAYDRAFLKGGESTWR